ncbi:hypothetical protein MPTK1_4g09520 [Marchantia polymorpha subsp. ruderalis]|uniref:Uncharacterized protein n=2 Tax=Marchantia polymorpha TaxID=3197 RepID=A0AAF6B847_MARPO|nr:hypothetical protein MARPO_0112s0057 [Marchantia polymorpha]BBN08181.1 hypothetical protein Mp_4g09520 [Marchantia polymorpha subsp. ruderalis]|eukprot:PTQ31415.1 hypothetical protein MARPO_0112s0057 [Marchantia polymorpha]
MTESVVCSGFLYVNMKEADVLFKEGNLSPNIILKTLVLLKLSLRGKIPSLSWMEFDVQRKESPLCSFGTSNWILYIMLFRFSP